MTKSLSAAWIADASKNFDAGVRFYIDPRGVEVPPLGAPRYSAVSGTNVPGSYGITSSSTYYWTPSDSFSVDLLYKSTSGTSVDSNLFWCYGAGYTILLRQTSGGSYNLILAGASTVTLSGGSAGAVQRVGFSFIAGGECKLYLDGTLVDTDTAPAMTTRPYYLILNYDENSTLHYVRVYDGFVASVANFTSNFDHVGNEEIFFAFNKTAAGRTRCNVNRPGNHLVTGYSIDRPSGYKAASATVDFLNLSGEFNDDIYATFEPQSGSFNGTSGQRYLRNRVGLEIETWYNGSFEPLFRGYIPPGSFDRSTHVGGLSTVSVQAEDLIATIARAVARSSYKWEDYYLCRAAPSSNSVFREIAQLATKRYIDNYCTNAGFENTTIANSWIGTATLTRSNSAPVLAGSYRGNFTGTDKEIHTKINFKDSFTGEVNVDKGDVFTGSIYVYATSAIQGKLKIAETLGINTETAFTHGGKGWEKFEVSHTIAEAGWLVYLYLTSVGAWTDVPIDCAMIKRGNPIDYWFDNTYYGSSGESTYRQYMTGAYDIVGIDGDDVAYQHPWAWIQKGENIWDNMKELAAACGGRVMRLDSSGVLRFRSGITTALPASLGTLANGSAISKKTLLSANKIKLTGANIRIHTAPECIWMADAAKSLARASGESKFTRSIANGDTLPDETLDGSLILEAIYGTVS
jgi:hypothetical protein